MASHYINIYPCHENTVGGTSPHEPHVSCHVRSSSDHFREVSRYQIPSGISWWRTLRSLTTHNTHAHTHTHTHISASVLTCRKGSSLRQPHETSPFMFAHTQTHARARCHTSQPLRPPRPFQPSHWPAGTTDATRKRKPRGLIFI